jgi:nicotinamidase/pyrazinamidase
MSDRTELVIIDPQVDFCDPAGALSVTGADQDMIRLADFIRRNKQKLDDINVTQDSHHPVDCAHPCFWVNSKGEHPEIYSQISAQDVRDGIWRPAKLALNPRMQSYVDSLEQGSRYGLTIWPPHCLIGFPGHAVAPAVRDALREWEEDRFALVNFVTKGSNVFTEHYSAVQAEVPDPEDPTTQLNTAFIDKLIQCNRVLVAGEALSHCVANTVRDVANAFGDDSAIEKIVLLTDATSPVGTFEQLADDFVKEMIGRGMKTATTQDSF